MSLTLWHNGAMGHDDTVHVTTREAWRAWLEQNHGTIVEIWLLFHKKHTGKPALAYDDAVEEALCFGWIDSLIRRIDDDTYARKFTPRKEGSVWSPLNIWRARRMAREKRMKEAGLALTGPWIEEEPGPRPKAKTEEPDLPDFLDKELKKNVTVWQNFQSLPPSQRRHYVLWITTAKREETRQRRLSEAVEKLERGEPLGMK